MKLQSLVLVFLVIAGCDKPIFEKPGILIPKKQMIDMLVDVHLGEAFYQIHRNNAQDIVSLKSEDFYYSVLKKYNVADSTFEKSLVYYASMPKEFEKMYSKVKDKLLLMEQKYIKTENKPVDIGNK